MAHFPFEEVVRWLFMSLCIAFFLNICAISFNVMQINNYEKNIDNYIANNGKLNSSYINNNLSPKFNNYFTVKPKSASDEKTHDFGKSVNYIVTVHIPLIAFANKNESLGINTTYSGFSNSKISN